MSEFEKYSEELLRSSKVFLEEAKIVDNSEYDRQRCLRASLTHAFFFLEAQMNYLSAHFTNSKEFEVLERSLLSEREIAIEKGKFVLTEKQKLYRLEERIEFLLYRFSANIVESKGTWFSELKDSINVRNRLVHPKEAHVLKVDEVERTIKAVLGCLSALYNAIFDKAFPLAVLGLHPGPERL